MNLKELLKNANGMFATANKNLADAQNKLVITADEKELDFFELEDEATVTIGAKANYDGEPANGEFLMPNGDTYIFDNGELLEIITKEAESEVLAENLKEALTIINKQNAKIKELSNLISNYNSASKPPVSVGKPSPNNHSKVKNDNSANVFESFKAVNQLVKQKK